VSECRCFRLVDARYAGEKGSVIQAREGCPIHCRRKPPRIPPVPSGTFVRKEEGWMVHSSPCGDPPEPLDGHDRFVPMGSHD